MEGLVYAENIKHKSYDKEFVGLNTDFFPVIVDTYGKWGQEGLIVINELITRGSKQTEIPFNTYCPQSWQKLSITLQRNNARMVFSRLTPARVY